MKCVQFECKTQHCIFTTNVKALVNMFLFYILKKIGNAVIWYMKV